MLVEIIDSGQPQPGRAQAQDDARQRQLPPGTAGKVKWACNWCARTTRRVEPTEVGLRLYEHGRDIQNEMRAARETITTWARSLHGRVGLSVPSGYGQMVMSRTG